MLSAIVYLAEMIKIEQVHQVIVTIAWAQRLKVKQKRRNEKLIIVRLDLFAKFIIFSQKREVSRFIFGGISVIDVLWNFTRKHWVFASSNSVDQSLGCNRHVAKYIENSKRMQS